MNKKLKVDITEEVHTYSNNLAALDDDVVQ